MTTMDDKRYDVTISETESYRFHLQKLEKPGPNHQWRRLSLAHSGDGGKTWVDVPLRLSLASRLKLLFAADPFWPPEGLRNVGHDAVGLWFEYVEDDDDSAGGRHMFLAPAVWRAVLNRAGRWNIRRVADAS